MKVLNKPNCALSPQYPVKVIQFGEGNFLRAFVDWMIHKANKNIDFNASVVIVQPLERGMVDLLKKQDNLYHVILQGIKDYTSKAYMLFRKISPETFGLVLIMEE